MKQSLLILLATIGAGCSALLAQEMTELDLMTDEELTVVSASKRAEKISETAGTVMVVTAQQIRENGYEDLEDVLRDLPGIDFVHVWGTFPTIWAQRGSYGDENKRTLVLIDGIVENNILEGNVLGGPQYSVHNAERIEVMWGPVSALYGANAFSGIINIVTKRGRDIDGAEYHKGYGSYNTSFDKILIGRRARGFEYALSGSLYNSDGPVFKERHPNYSLSYVSNAYSVVGRASFMGLEAGFSRYDRPMGHGQFTNSPAVKAYGLPLYGYNNSEGDSLGGAQTEFDGQRPSNWHSSTQTAFLQTDRELGRRLRLQGKLYYRKSGIEDDSYGTALHRSGVFRKNLYTHTSDLYGGEVQTDFPIDRHQDATIGIQYEQSNVEQGYRIVVKIDSLRSRLLDEGARVYNIYRNRAVYCQYLLRPMLLYYTSFTAGMRYDENNIYGSTVNPRVGLVSRPAKQLTVKLLYGTAYRAPTSFELFTQTATRIPNPDLKPEKVRSSEISIGYRPSGGITVEGCLFYNDFKDIIVSNVGIGSGLTQNRNLATATIAGSEIKATVQYRDNLTGFANFSIQDGRMRDTVSTDVPNIARFKGNLGVTCRISELFTLNLVENWVGDRSTAPTNPAKTIPGYTVTNLALSTRQLGHTGIFASIVVENLLNDYYVDPGIRAADGGYYGTRHLQPGRSVTMKLTYALDG